jgi:hypothetical protein
LSASSSRLRDRSCNAAGVAPREASGGFWEKATIAIKLERTNRIEATSSVMLPVRERNGRDGASRMRA